ncbi:type II secretion system F family protein [bacterium]|nr:type II secretion system F family protein [bacterium]
MNKPREVKKPGITSEVYLSKVSDLHVALAIRHLALMLKSGLSLSESIKVLGKQSEDARLRKAFEEIYSSLAAGNNLSSSMSKYPKIFSEMVVSLVTVGEEAAVLEKNLLFLAEYLKKKYEFDKRIKGAMTYPIIIFSLTGVEMLGMVFFILPRMEALFSSFKNIPPFTKAILDATAFMRTNGLYILLGVVALGLIGYIFLKTKIGRRISDYISLRFPVLGKVNRFRFLANFSRTLGILLESGTSFSQSLKVAAESVNNTEYINALEEVRKDVKGGKNLATALALHPKLFPETYTKILEISEGTGTLEENLAFLADYYTEEVTDLTENLATLLEPVMLILVAVMIGVLAITIVGPIYQLIGSIN